MIYSGHFGGGGLYTQSWDAIHLESRVLVGQSEPPRGHGAPYHLAGHYISE